MRVMLGLGMLLLAAAPTAAQPTGAPPPTVAPHAAPVDGGPPADAPAPISHRINLRAGLASSDTVGRPAICLEVVAIWQVSVEGCGTGSGILHDDVGRQIAHFRANIPITTTTRWGGRFALRGGLGFAELEIGDDKPGFDFGEADTPASVAGPDAGLSVQWLRPVGAGIELVANASGGVAWFAGAEDLVVPQRELQPYVAFELGVGW